MKEITLPGKVKKGHQTIGAVFSGSPEETATKKEKMTKQEEAKLKALRNKVEKMRTDKSFQMTRKDYREYVRLLKVEALEDFDAIPKMKVVGIGVQRVGIVQEHPEERSFTLQEGVPVELTKAHAEDLIREGLAEKVK